MFNDKKQNQAAGDDSTNMQASSIVVHQGISYSDARDIALDVFKSNFLKLSENAAGEARKRAEEITDEFLAELKERNPDGISELESPGMQHALFVAQKDYARTGDKDLESLLIDILVDRTSTEDRSLQQIVLDEALTIAPKLNAPQMDVLTANFLSIRTVNHSVNNLDKFATYLDTHIAPFLGATSASESCFGHLQYTGCCSIALVGGYKKIEELYLLNYPGLFMKGFDSRKLDELLPDSPIARQLIIPCLHDESLYQVYAMTADVLTNECERISVPPDDRPKLLQLFNQHKMSAAEVVTYVSGQRPEIGNLLKAWPDSHLSKLTLTSVGICIAHANFRRRTGLPLDLSIWVN